MPNAYYSSNAKITGGALFISFNSKDGCVFMKLLKQIANNNDKRNNFDGANPINIKLSQDEVADIIRAVRTNGEAKFFHKFENNTSSGSFKYYTIPSTEAGKPDRHGFGLSVKKGDKEIKVGFTPASAERFSLYLQNALVHIFNAEYSEDLKQAKEYAAKKKEFPQESPEPAPEQEDDKEF